MNPSIVVYDLELKKKAYLENAFKIGYEERYNSIWTAEFSLPVDDPKRVYCRPLWFVEIFDGKQRVDLFRILPSRMQHDNSGKVVTYQAEHVLATLLDDVLFKYHQIGGTGVYTQEVLQYIMAFQDVPRWQLGTVEFTRQFQYSWENENLLAALFSVPKPFDQEYRWTWDTSSYPWTLNLVAADETPGPEIRYRRNMHGVEIDEDPTNLCTRLYVLGYGEGVNQLGIEGVNPTGKPYIDADTIPLFGKIQRVWVDRRYENAENLYNSAVAALERMKMPRISVSVKAVDLFRITHDLLDKFVLGRKVRVYDEDLGLDYVSRVISKRKTDVLGAPGDVKLEIANAPQDIAGTISELANRTRINEVYSQGATNLDSYVLTDNCDPENPARFKFHISPDVVYINKALLNFEIGAFRAYSKAVAGGGAHSDTTRSGGAYSDTTPSGGGTTSGPSSRTTTVSADERIDVTGYRFDSGPDVDYTRAEKAAADNHNHGIPSGTVLATVGGGSVTFLGFSGSSHSHWLPPHSHFHVAYGHSHGMNHTHDCYDHTHSYSVPGHSHGFSIPNHEHEIEYGIYRGPTPTKVTIKVDGNVVPGLGTSESGVDIVSYLKKDGGGRIERGWHELEIIPDTLGRVVVTLHLQVFIQSRGEVKL